MATPNHSWPGPATHPQQQQQQQQLQYQQQYQPHPQHQHQQRQQQQQQQQGPEEMGVQTRPMGLKVHYTFDRDNQVNCLARWPHILHVQTVPVDERNTIGVIDLRTCLQAIAQCSPELVNQQESDYTVYAYDYSEPDTPLVGQGMLSWGLDFNNDQQQQQQQQLVTGRVTRNLLAILSNGSRETLEVKMKLTAVAKMHQRSGFASLDGLNMIKSAHTPIDTTSSEWNSFIQSNPMLGHSGNLGSIPSPSLPPTQFSTSMNETRPVDFRPEYPQQHQPIRPASIPPPTLAPAPTANALPPPNTTLPPTTTNSSRPAGPPENAPSPPITSSIENLTEKAARPASRPSSRASRRSRVPTGRPRGRPRKTPLDTGNTSAAEEATTDGDDGPQKKRAKITQAEYSAVAPFGSAPDSLRVTASTAGSLRNMRPIGAGGVASAGNQVQDVPRAPTPVPDMSRLPKHHMRRGFEKSKSEVVMGSECGIPYQSRFSQPAMQRSLSMDGLSPTESAAHSPDPGYTPEDSPGDIGSSPPVPRASAYMRTSPVASSPILPPMPLPLPQVDSGFMSGGIDDFFDEEQILQDLPQEQGQDLPQRPGSQLKHAPAQIANKPNSRKNSRAPQKQPDQHNSSFSFKEVNPGPPELLPTKSIYNPTLQVKSLINRDAAQAVETSFKRLEAETAAVAPPVDIGEPPSEVDVASFHRMVADATAIPSQGRAADLPLKRATTDPTPSFSELEQPLQERSISHQPVLESTHDVPDIQMSEALVPPTQLTDDQSQSFSLADSQPQPLAEAPRNEAPEVSEEQQQEISEPTMGPPESLPAPEYPAPEPVLTLPTKPIPKAESLTVSTLSLPTVPASDPVPEPPLTFPQAFMSEAPCPPGDSCESRYNKNLVKKQSIKERLETAIEKGEMPPFCNNCGAIETPTWRKIWTQEHQGVPEFHEFSDKPGMVTMVDIIQRDADGKPLAHLLVKKNLGPKDDKKLWKETILCNPCGIWLAKFKSHRPPDRWDKDAARLNQPRKKRERNRSKKSRTKSDAQMNPTSEAYFTTDPLGPADRDSPKFESFENGTASRRQSVVAVDDGNDKMTVLNDECLNSNGSPKQSRPGSTHSRGSGTADSPIAVEDDLGPTRRLLFPSPRKDGVPKVLGELAVNIVQTTTTIQEAKSAGTGKENATFGRPEVPARPTTPIVEDHDLEQELFGTPPRPSTPPPKSAIGPFKTPTRATPSHRPVTRSISRSIAKSPGQALLQLQRTPSKTPRSTRSNNTGLLFGLISGSAIKRRSPRHAHFALDDDFIQNAGRFGNDCSPFTASLTQLLSEANEFTHGSPSHGLVDLDLSALPNLDSDDHQAMLDFGNFLSTDLVMPSSPPLMRNHAAAAADYFDPSPATVESLWAQMAASVNAGDSNAALEKGNGKQASGRK